MKTLNFIAVLMIVGLIWGCDTKEKKMLLSKVDSLQVELNTSLQTAQTLQEIGTLIDSIDASRQLLKANVVEGTSYADYKGRLNEINNYIKETQQKIAALEKSLKQSNINYTATIKRMKLELVANQQQLAALQGEVDKMRSENQALALTINQKDQSLEEQQGVIKMREQDIATLEAKVQEINTLSVKSQADLFFAQARALETAAQRTKFAPKKKKETQREALELYRQSFSLGKQEAQQRIEELEKALG
ncbi:MAG TPA: hypothetical protein PLV21_14320 [Cyclobacteriaceae bacterium]|nr:hypothetical protein [Cyclobacteriaceae bacterium]HRJ83062.1 hypothetical protein [Cyclobacteriaceae bacterium]